MIVGLTVGMLAAVLAAGGDLPSGKEDVVGIKPHTAGIRVIDEKCLECHNRQRIEEAARQEKNMAEILRRMEKRGVTLTAQEREVMGHFWRQSPLRSNK